MTAWCLTASCTSFWQRSLPHAEARHAGHEPRPAGCPKRRRAEFEAAAASHQFMHDRRLSDARRADQQNAFAPPLFQSIGQRRDRRLALISPRERYLPHVGAHFAKN